MLHVFGESHAREGWNQLEPRCLVPGKVSIHCAQSDPPLMHSIGKKGLEVLDITRVGVRDGDIIIFCYGEVDCRCHIYKHLEQGLDYVVNNLAIDYMNTIALNVKRYKDLRVGVYNVLPPAKKSRTWDNPSLPFLGTDEERLSYVIALNNKLEQACKEHGYIFVDIFKDYADSEGFMNPALSSDGLHISDPIGLARCLNRLFFRS